MYVYVADRRSGVKWRNWKVHLIWQENMRRWERAHPRCDKAGPEGGRPGEAGCGSGSWAASVCVWAIMSRRWGPRGGRAVPEGANVAFPHALQRPDGAKPYRVGVLNEAFGPNPPVVLGLKAGLAEFGLQEGRDVVFETVLTRGQLEALPVEDSTKFEL